MRQITIEQFHSELEAQGVEHRDKAVVCPLCGTAQSMNDFAKAGLKPAEIEKVFAFSCIGRWTGKGSPPKVKGTQDGCNYTLGGLLKLHELEVILEHGAIVPAFRPATPEEIAE